MKRFFVDERGQAFDVFKLLIAAVVALAILAVLWPIIQNLVLPGQDDPNQAAANDMKNSVIGVLHTTQTPVTFKKEGVLSAKAIAQATQQYSPDQICLVTGDYEGEPIFEKLSGTTGGSSYDIIRYAGSAAKQVKLSVLCDTGEDLDNDLQNAGIENWSASDCECSGGGDKCCIVALRYS